MKFNIQNLWSKEVEVRKTRRGDYRDSVGDEGIYTERKFNIPRAVATTLTLSVGVIAAKIGLSGLYKVEEGFAGVEKFGGKVVEIHGPGYAYALPFLGEVINMNTTAISEVPLGNIKIYYSPDEVEKTVLEETASVEENIEEKAEEKTPEQRALDNAQQYTTHKTNIRFSINPEATRGLYAQYPSMDLLKRLVRDRGTEAYKAVIRKIDPLKINTLREEIGPEAANLLQDKLNEELQIPMYDEEGNILKNEHTGEVLFVKNPIKIASIVFIDFEFEKGVVAAFEEANKERASIQAEEYRRQREQTRVQTERLAGEADAAREIQRSLGSATAMDNEGAALRRNPGVLGLRVVDAWRGGAKVPSTLVMTGDSDSLTDIVPLQVAPIQVQTEPSPQ